MASQKPRRPADPPADDKASPGKRKAEGDEQKEQPKKRRYSDAIVYLAEQVSEIKNYLHSMHQPLYQSSERGDDEIEMDVSRQLYDENVEDKAAQSSLDSKLHQPSTLKFSFNTVLKEPSVPKSSQNLLETIKAVQHFESEDWSNVRYSEVQKQYVSRPGYTDLETNEEIKAYDKYTNLSPTERGFTAITQALVKQGEAAQSGFEALISWSRSTADLSPTSLQDKINQIFIQGGFQKISNDLIQLSCGHRADLIQQRRDNILRSVKDKYFKETLRKIPPSCNNLFQKEHFSAALEKNGGVSKTFWPLRAPTQNKPAAQAGSDQSNSVNIVPAQGTSDSFRFFNYSMPPLPTFDTFRSFRQPGAQQSRQPTRQRGGRSQAQDGYQTSGRTNNRGRSNKSSSQKAPRRDFNQRRKY
ncbi:hypothetical protein NE865_14899 [Phthorimaea operculella]|nr:hypothetical protein NE865_14899 [Phthorimaea operculella]